METDHETYQLMQNVFNLEECICEENGDPPGNCLHDKIEAWLETHSPTPPKQTTRIVGACPYPGCDGEDIEGGSFDVTETHCHQPVTCLTCGRSWNDIYRIYHQELLNE